VPFFTYEQIFENDQLPRALIVVGGGPIGMEMAQAYQRLGSRVKRSSGRLIFYEKTVVSKPRQPLGHLSPLNPCVTDQPQSQARAISQKA